MANVIVYMKPTCPYCQRAIATLEKHQQHPILIDITGDDEKRAEMIAKIPAGRQPTVPQIFINDEYIGGCDDLHALPEQELTEKLGV